MTFSSREFLFLFLPLCIIIYGITPNRWRNYILLLASIVYYILAERDIYLILLFIFIIINYITGIIIEKYQESKHYKKIALTVGIVINLLLLGIFKYTNFVIGNINIILSFMHVAIPQVNLPFPLGISFITFQCLTYIIDIYRGQAKAEHRLSMMALYVSMFPKIIAGPIVKYKDMANQLVDHKLDVAMIEEGIIRFLIGLGKKVIIADTLGLAADAIFGTRIEHMSSLYAWIGIIAYTLQIYYDFSGYSDMAIGLGRIFGYKIMENFNYPYSSKSITEFWRRWHISLSTWFREYLYIPLGGNRHGIQKTYRNLIIVFILTGLWHGASWTFVVWGLYHGAFMIIERMGLKKILDKYGFIGTIYSILVVMIGWVFFRSPDIQYALQYIYLMFSFNDFQAVHFDAMRYVTNEFWIYVVIAILFSFPIVPYLKKRMNDYQELLWYKLSVYGYTIILFIIAFMYIAKSSYNPFIYSGF